MITKEVYEAFVRHLIAGNRSGCAQVVHGMVEAKVEVKELYTELFQRALYEVGDLWERNQISVATEHLATAITEGLMNLVRPVAVAPVRDGQRVVIACIANELHQIGAKMVADICEMNGWEGYFLGANTPGEDLLSFIGQHQLRRVGLSVSLERNLPVLSALIDRLQVTYPALEIWVGGQALRKAGAELFKERSGVKHVLSLQHMERLIAGP